MLTNKDISVENGNIVINGDKYPLDGQSPEAIMQIVEDNSDTTPTAESSAPVTSAGIKNYVDTVTTALGLFDIQDYTAASPGTGTSVEKATRVISDVLTNITLTKNFTVVNVNYDTAYRGTMLISAATSSLNYSLGIYIGYYTDNVYKFFNNNGVITVKQLAEVS